MLIYAAVAAVLVLGVLYYFYADSKDRHTTIPGPIPSSNEEGNLPDIKKAGGLTDFLVKIHNEFGSIVSFWLGKQMIISITSPELFKETAHLFDRPAIIFADVIPLIGEGSIQYGCGEEARARRKVQDRSFSHEAVVRKISLFQEVGNELVDKWKTMCKKGEQLPLSENMYNSVLKILSQFAFGDYFKDEKRLSQFKSDYDEGFRVLSTIPVDGPILPGSDREKRVLRAKENMKSVVLSIIKEREKQEIAPENKLLIDTLMDAYDNEDLLFSDALTFLIAGFHTTATTLIWVFYFLAREPRIQEKCHKEIQSVWNDGSPLDWTTIKQMKYMYQVMYETMRMTRTGAFAARFSTTDMMLGGHKVPKNTPIMQSVGVTMSDEKYFPHPDKFDPDRFSEENKPASMVFEPFGFAGKRKCPGYRLSEVESVSIMATLLSKFKIKLVPDQHIEFKFEFATQPTEEIWISLEERDQ